MRVWGCALVPCAGWGSLIIGDRLYQAEDFPEVGSGGEAPWDALGLAKEGGGVLG